MVNMRKEIVEICAEVEIAHGALLRASMGDTVEALRAISEYNQDGENPFPILEEISIVGGEEILHPQGEEFWEVLWDLSDFQEEDEDLLEEHAVDLYRIAFDLAQAGVQVVLVAGSCGLCDEEHFWVAAPAAQVRALLRRVQDGEVQDQDLPGLGRIPGVLVEYGVEILLRRIPNPAGGFYEEVARPITVTISGREEANGVHRFVDVVRDAPWQVGGNSGEARRLWASSEFEEQADWGDIQLAWGR